MSMRMLDILPYLSYGIIAVMLAVLELRAWIGVSGAGQYAEAGMGGFHAPEGVGYEYCAPDGTILYIHQKSRKKCHVYLIRGALPRVRMRIGLYGRYFCIYCQDPYHAEKIIDSMFSGIV